MISANVLSPKFHTANTVGEFMIKCVKLSGDSRRKPYKKRGIISFGD